MGFFVFYMIQDLKMIANEDAFVSMILFIDITQLIGCYYLITEVEMNSLEFEEDSTCSHIHS